MLKKLSNAYGPSAKEEEVRKIILKELSDFYSDIKTDNLGNLIIHKPGKKKSIAITAPMDEVSFLVTHNKNNDYSIASSICFVKQNTLQNKLFKNADNKKFILNKIDNKSEKPEKSRNIEFLNLDRCKVNKPYNDFVSDLLVFDNKLAETDDFYIGKALERAVCCSILCEIARNVANSMYEYYFVFSAQNYCDKKGALTATHNLKIDELYNLCVVDADSEKVDLGKGPVVIVRDKMLISNKDLIDNLCVNFTPQCIISSNFICEGGYYQRQPATQKVVSVGIGANFLGCFNEIVSKSDIISLKDLITEKVLP